MVFILLLVSWKVGQRQSSVGLSLFQQGKGTEFGVPRAHANSLGAKLLRPFVSSLQGRKWWEEEAEPQTCRVQVPESYPHWPLQSWFGLPDSPSWHSAPLPRFPLLLKVGSPVVRPHLQWANLRPGVGGRDHGSLGPRSSERLLT